MDIWRWVHETQRNLVDQGHGRLAELMDALPHSVVVEENHDLEAIAPEALGLARALDLPWVEVFVRHWYRQGRGGGFEELPDAIDLLEFSHRDENRDCPQSVCTVQDVSIAYGAADGPGFAQERLEVSKEALARIDPTWPCFSCISSQYAAALIDAERAEEAVEFVQAQRAQVAATGRELGAELINNGVAALLDLRRAEEALERLDAADRALRDREEDIFARARRSLRARALLQLGRAEEAAAVMLDHAQVVREISEAEDWVETVVGLVAAGVRENDWRLGTEVEHLLGILIERGRAWEAVLVAGWHAELALGRGSAVTARHALSLLRTQAARLRDPARVRERIDALESAVAAHESDVSLPESPDALFEALGEQDAPDPEEHAERLDAACRRWPDDLRLVMALAAALEALERPDAAAAALRDYVERHPDDQTAWRRYGFALMDAGDHEALEALAARVEPRDAADAAWLRANQAWRTGDHRVAADLAAQVIELHPDALNARRLRAAACDELGDFAESLRLRTEVLSLAGEDEDLEVDHWMRMMSAAATGEWRVLRESAKALELSELGGDPDSPPDERWGLIRLRYDARDVVWARRLGPVTARVIEVSSPGRPQHADDVVVYDPDLLEYPTEETAGLGRVVKVLSDGGMRSFVLDGVHPGDDRWDAFVEVLETVGMLVDRRSPDEYQLEVEGESRLGIYAMLGVPEETTDAAAHAQLTDLTADWEHPIVWIALAEAAGAMEDAERQREIAERLDL